MKHRIKNRCAITLKEAAEVFRDTHPIYRRLFEIHAFIGVYTRGTTLLTKDGISGEELLEHWLPGHPSCSSPEKVAYGSPKFGQVIPMVFCECDDDGKPTKPLHDQMMFHEGPEASTFPGTLAVPWFRTKNGRIFVVVRTNSRRVIFGEELLEFPQGLVEESDGKDLQEAICACGVRELKEEIDLDAKQVVYGGSVCPEPDWFETKTHFAFCEVGQDAALEAAGKHGRNAFEVTNPTSLQELTIKMQPGPSKAALLHFILWMQLEFPTSSPFSQ